MRQPAVSRAPKPGEQAEFRPQPPNTDIRGEGALSSAWQSWEKVRSFGGAKYANGSSSRNSASCIVLWFSIFLSVFLSGYELLCGKDGLMHRWIPTLRPVQNVYWMNGWINESTNEWNHSTLRHSGGKWKIEGKEPKETASPSSPHTLISPHSIPPIRSPQQLKA